MKKGIILALATAIISGFSIFYNKIAVVSGVDPLIFNIIKNGGVAFILTTFLFSSKKIPALKHLQHTAWVKLFGIGLIGGALPFILFFSGLKTISALNANVIHKTLFIWVALFAVPILKEKISMLHVVGFISILFGSLVLGGLYNFHFGFGELLIVSATILWAIENVIAKIALRRIDPMIIAWARMFIGTCFLILIAANQGKISLLWSFPKEYIVPTIGSIGLLTGYVLTWYHALQKAPATIVSAVLVFATVITNVLSTMFIPNTLPRIQFESSIAITIGVFLIAVCYQRYSTNKTLIRT